MRPRRHRPPRRHTARRSPPRRRPSGAASTRSNPSSCWPSRASSTAHAPRPASTPAGPTATCRTARASIMTERHRAQMERFAPGFRELILARHARTAGRLWSCTIPTASAATSTAACRICGRSLPARHCRRIPTPPHIAGVVSLFRLHPTGRRRTRHVRLSCGAGGAAASPIKKITADQINRPISLLPALSILPANSFFSGTRTRHRLSQAIEIACERPDIGRDANRYPLQR